MLGSMNLQGNTINNQVINDYSWVISPIWEIAYGSLKFVHLNVSLI